MTKTILPRSPERGYTLLEMIIVLVVIGLIAAIVTPQVGRLLGGAKHDAAKLQADALAASVNYYFLDTGSYPSNAAGLLALWEHPEGVEEWRGPYIAKEGQLRDPWGRSFTYRIRGDKKFEIISWGSDGQEGGSGEDADISSLDG